MFNNAQGDNIGKKSMCAGKKEKKCKDNLCVWAGEACTDKAPEVSSLKDKFGSADHPMNKIQPNSSVCASAEISALLVGAFVAMWYGWN